MLCGTILYEKSNPPQPSNNTTGGQRAVFIKDMLWPIGSTIRIYFYDYSKLKIVSKSEYDSIPLDQRKNYIYWEDISWVLKRDLERYFDPLYQTLQNKVDPGELVRRVITERFAPIVNLKFEFVNNPYESDIRIQFDSTLGSSHTSGRCLMNDLKCSIIGVGLKRTLKEYYNVNFKVLDVGTVLHEWGHVLGMHHEHKTPNGNPIQWNIPAVMCTYNAVTDNAVTEEEQENVQFNVIDRLNVDSINGSNYDDASIMLYSIPKVVECKGKFMMLTTNGYSVNPNYRLSNTDIRWLEYMYPKNGIRQTNLPPDVIATEKFDPNSTENQIAYFWADHWPKIVGAIGGFIGLVVLIRLYRYAKARRIRRKSVSTR